MPEYVFKNPQNGKLINVIQSTNDAHVYERDGVKFERVFTIPQTNIDTKLNPLSSSDFIKKTKDKKGTLGDLYDLSREASEKRKQLTGKDEVKEKYFEEYSKKRRGRKHLDSYLD